MPLLWSSSEFNLLSISMLDLASLMANLRFTKEDFTGMETLHFEEDRQVKGSETWLVGKIVASSPIDHDMLLRVFKAIWKDHPLEDASSRASEDGPMKARASNMEHDKVVAIGTTDPKHSKRTYVREDGESSLSVTKKARSATAKSDVVAGQEEKSPLLTLTSVEAAEQPRRGQ
ncbi:hypothetical protein V6N11_069453 [Hibiscus sabdariffa]|uniref:Uncharacterized protein n=1 Tax=Hibiscus sabdariffa TaxID=183260 RepID=A0ABR2Q2T0_9ROSI